MKIALTIAGSDSGGGAGLQADLKTFHQFGVFGTSVVTAVTAQNTAGVLSWEAVSRELVSHQIDAVVGDLRPAALKTGMLGTAAVIDIVGERIRFHNLSNYVLDPVMVATSGDALMQDASASVLGNQLVALATVVTPNLDEAEALLHRKVRSIAQMEDAGREFVRKGARAALIKGGHLAGGDTIVDVLVQKDGIRHFSHPRIDTSSTHGTGCTLSAAITAGLALGRPLEQSVADAIDFVHRAIAAAPGLGNEKGHGPLNHFVPAPPRPPTEGC